MPDAPDSSKRCGGRLSSLPGGNRLESLFYRCESEDWMYLQAIACEVLAREVYLAAATSPHTVDVELVAKGLHDTPDLLQAELQRRIDAEEGGRHDAIVLAYGLCGNATAGLVAHSKPVVVVRAHDCITLYLGSRDCYSAEFANHPGTYYYSDDYLERSERTDAATFSALGASDLKIQQTYEEYIRLYGEDNAQYLMEVMGTWHAHYNRAAFIDMQILEAPLCRQQARDEAQRRGWAFADLKGDPGLIRRLVHGDWDDDFLVLRPGQSIAATHTDDVMAAIDVATPE
jgi:hypothetical protein